MPEVLSRVQQQLSEFWKNLDKSQKNRIYITSGVLIIVITVCIVMLTRTTYVPLMTLDDPKDAAEIEKVLQEKNIKYKPGGGGQILIDSRDKNKAEFAVASSGLTSSGMTFEDAWNMLNISTTESDKKHLWNNFKRNNIVAKIKMFDNVKDADVDLTQPDNSMFFSESNDNEAKAFVRIKPRGEITPEQVQGIVSVVSACIEGLKPQNVTVVDSNFNILRSEESDEIGKTSNQFKLKLKIKEEIENSVKRLYPGRSDIFDNISVVANPVLQLDKVKSTTNEILKPTGLDEAIVSSEDRKEKLENDTPNGEPGIGSNPGNAPSYPMDSGENSTYEKSEKIRNYDYTRKLTEEEKAYGIVDSEKSSMTVALFYGQRVKDDSRITPEFIEQVKQDVSTATGIPSANISVNKYPLAPLEEITIPVAERIRELVDSYGFFALMLMLIIGLMVSVLPRRKKTEALQPAAELALAEGPAFMFPENEEVIAEINLEEQSEIKKQIEKFVAQKPEAVANLLRNWLSDDWD
ncbi:MAG: flagellar M-ring protein FliF [Clostridiaceae bacterium]|nr:flagellar M-ring protein FliF [Clostridiaceae bacterium]